MATKLATPAAVDERQRFDSVPSLTRTDAGSFTRALQVAVALGLRPTTVDATAGLLVLEGASVDDIATSDATDGLPRVRRLTITIVVGKRDATTTPAVVTCVGTDCGPRETTLFEEESLLVRRLNAALGTSKGPPPADTTQLSRSTFRTSSSG